jgi:hypothetical protein
MTYNEIQDKWNVKQEEAPFIAKLDPSDQKAWLVLQVLDRRLGFAEWFELAKPEYKDDIFEQIKAVVNGVKEEER